MSHSLENAIAVVTGGAAGIGRETCLKLGRMGARVIVSDIDTHSGEETAALLRTTGVEAHFVAADVGLRP